MKKLAFIFVLIMCFSCENKKSNVNNGMSEPAASLSSQSGQTLSWNINFLKGAEKESVPISGQVVMENGDIFQLTVKPDSDCYCYLVHYDSERQISVLYDQMLTANDEKSLDPWQLTAPSGTETIYVIMSLEKLAKLEGLIQNHKDNPDSRQHGNNLYQEVVSLQNTVSALGEPASTVVTSGGTTRGDPPEYINQFSGKNLYVRPITIRH